MSARQVDLVRDGTPFHPGHTLATRYRYNSRNQLTDQESPDAGESGFWYNKAGQLRMSQDARQAAAGAYSYTRYDRQGRVTETGEFPSAEPIDSLKIKLNGPAFPDPAQYTCHDLTRTFYDRAKAYADPTFVQENLRGRVSWTAMVEKGAADTVFTLYSYDPHGNVKALLQDLPGLGPKRTEYRYDLISGNENLLVYQYGRPEQLIHRYRYDADNRIEEVHTSTDGFVWNREATYFYYPHGPLARVELGEYNVQGMDYYYTLQGWLKGVNMPSEGDPGGDGVNGFRTGTDAFAFALGYYEGDYKPVNPTVTLSDSRDKLWDRYREIRDTPSAQGLYNGNISWMNTDLPGLPGGKRMQAMVYGYDQLHRIVQARSLTEYGTVGYTRNDSIKPYDTDYSYDPNGNLLTLQRLDSQTAVRDDLTYEYNAGTNRLRNTDVADGENYTYDEIGNLISDAEEGIDSIAWTPYGKVRKIEKSDNSSVSFRYGASGNRIAKITDSDTTIYVRDASGNVMGVYKNDTLIEQAIYGSSRLGLMTASSKAGYRTLGGKKYELSNHLGNVLAVVTDNIHLDQDSTWAEISSITDYYPFGLAMDGRTEQDSTYRYGFNGMEHDSLGIGGGGPTYDFGARIYDPRVGRWLSVDPLASKFPSWSSYNFVLGNPIRFIDPDGRSPWDIIVTTNAGKELFRLDDGKTEITTLTAKQVYARGIQWFESTADNYMPLISKANGLSSFSELKHFSWDEVADFSETDRWMITYRTGGSGDWKADGKPGDGYLMVTVGGEPYWTDAIGQIPFAVDKFTDDLESNGNNNAARQSTIEAGQRFGNGNLIGTESDNSNNYDNAMINRAINWAEKRYNVTKTPWYKWGNYDLQKTNYPPSNLSKQSHENQ